MKKLPPLLDPTANQYALDPITDPRRLGKEFLKTVHPEAFPSVPRGREVFFFFDPGELLLITDAPSENESSNANPPP